MKRPAFVLATAMVVAAYVLPASAAMQSGSGDSFLKTAAQEHENAVILGQLAMRKAASREVKAFAAKMIEDHQIAIRQVKQLASKEGISLPTQVSEQQRLKQQELAKLGDREFDRAYMQHMVRAHTKDVAEFERNVEQLGDDEVKRWAYSILPVLQQHLRKAFHITSIMIIDAAHAQLATYFNSHAQEMAHVGD